ncbi:MAG TPA: tripartite tricarboxylate transporter substrate-binding protein, partial [Candidatus Binatia bacterium]|nr:tripartite tricarboxylate transporter substrate-binding protein [Candidatus Binatia bacterium]
LAEDFYKGKTIRVIVGVAAGGGYDTYARMVARHINRHIPGNPETVVENMTGAGGLVAANHLYKQATPDGLTLAMFNNSLVVQKGLGDPRIRIDFRKLGWIGAPSVGVPVCMVMGFTGLKTLEDVLNYKKPLKVGATRAGSTGHDLPLILNKTLGTQFEVISGYTGTATTRLALQAHELEAFCSQWESMRVTARAMLEASGGDKLIPFVISERVKDPEVKHLPSFKEAIKDPKKYAIYRAWASQMDFQRPFSVPPETPKDRIEILRKGLADTLKDPELLKEAKKSELIITPVSGEETEKLVDEILSMPADVKQSLSFLVRKPGK